MNHSDTGRARRIEELVELVDESLAIRG